MTPEEYQKFKEAEKTHLRKLKELKRVHAQSARKASVTKAVTDMALGVSDLYDEHREMVGKLEMGAATSEARMEVALDSLGVDPIKQQELDAAALEADDEAMKKVRAQALIRQMKMESAPEKETFPEAGSTAQAQQQQGPSKDSSELPEKTIGKMKP